MTDDRLEPLTYRGNPRAAAVGLVTDSDGISSAQFPMGLMPGEALGLLRAGANHLDMARLEVLGSVAAARSAGVSWDGIANILGEPRTTVVGRYREAVEGAQVVVVAAANGGLG